MPRKQVDGRSTEKGSKGENSAAAMSVPGQADSESAVPTAAVERPDFPDLGQAGIEHIEPDEVDKWARQLDVSAPRLREAIRRVGPVVRDVKEFLASARSRS